MIKKNNTLQQELEENGHFGYGISGGIIRKWRLFGENVRMG